MAVVTFLLIEKQEQGDAGQTPKYPSSQGMPKQIEVDHATAASSGSPPEETRGCREKHEAGFRFVL